MLTGSNGLPSPSSRNKPLQCANPKRICEADWMAHLEALPMAAWLGESDGENFWVNRAWKRLLGSYADT